MNPGQPPPETARFARVLPFIVVAAACLFNAIAYQAELRGAAPEINDDVFHLGLIQRMSAAWEAGGNPLDTWVGYWGQGFPVLRYYQHLPHLVVVLAYRLLGQSVPLHVVYDAARLLMLTLLPLTFYLGSRRLGADRLTAAFIAVCTPLLGADPSQHHFLGFQPRSFLWSGGGLFAQLAAMLLFPLALGTVSQAALEGRRVAPAIGWLGATWLSHLVLGYTACLLGLIVLLRPEARGRRVAVALRLCGIYAGAAIVAAYLLVPTLLEAQWLSRSAWEPAEYWDSYGAQRVLNALVTGGLLDGNRPPVLTLLAGIGALLAGRSCLQPARHEHGFAMAALGIFVLGLLLFFGRPTWGSLLNLLPFSANLPFHRFICAVQFGGVLLAGYALARLAGAIAWSANDRRATVAAAASLAVLSPAIASTTTFAARNSTWIAEAAESWSAAGAPLEDALADFTVLDRTMPGRGYAGASWDWGREFRVGGVNVYHRWSAHDLPAISYMYHTMGLNSDLEPAFDATRRDHFELFNVRYVLADETRGLPTFARQRLIAAGLVSGLVETEGFFGVVGSAAFFRHAGNQAGPLRELNRAFIASGWHAEGRHVRIGWRPGDQASAAERPLPTDGSAGFERPPAWKPPRGIVISSRGDGDQYHARVRLDDPGIILFRMTYHPNWKAELDGEAVETVMLTPGYVGVPATPGDHAVTMTYRSPRWTRGLLWLGLGFLGLVAIVEARRRPNTVPR